MRASGSISLRPDLLDRLRTDLVAADFTVEAVAGLLGHEADQARRRGLFGPAHAVLAARESSSLEVLIRLFLLGDEVESDTIDTSLPETTADGLVEGGVAERLDTGRLRAALSLNPERIADAREPHGCGWWILSDLDDHLRRGPARHDHVMGVGGATRSLIALVPSEAAGASLDLGTGCGVVALHLACCGPVVATDISERALELARANARLNAVSGIEFRAGDLFEPVRGERFDLIVSNPPFVISPRSANEDPALRYEYRDAGEVGDALVRRVIREGVTHLAPGGTLLALGNWESTWGEVGHQKVGEWIRESGERDGATVAGWVIERDRLSPLQYAETWARDGGHRAGTSGYAALVSTWMADFASRRVVSIGLGSVRVRRLDSDGGRAIIRTEQATGPLENGTVGDALASAFAAALTTERQADDAVLDSRWLTGDDVREIRELRPGEEHPLAITLRRPGGLERTVVADTLLAAAVGASDGDLTLGQIADALAHLLEVDPSAARAALVAEYRELAWLGLVRPLEH